MSRRSTLMFALALLGGCTFNVASFSRDVTSTAPDAPITLHTDVSHLANLSGFGLEIVGDATATAPTATVTIAGLLGSGGDANAIATGVHVSWNAVTGDATARTLVVGYDGPLAETVWTEGVRVALAPSTALDVTAGATSVDVRGVTGAMHIVADSGSIDASGAGLFDLHATSGSIRVQGAGGTAECDSGSIDVDATGALIAHTTSGSIAGSIGTGGELGANSGSIDISLTAALDRDLTLSADSGSIHVTVPAGSQMRIETHTGSGSSHVSVGGVMSDQDFTGTVGAGGFLLRATTDSGSIVIDER